MTDTQGCPLTVSHMPGSHALGPCYASTSIWTHAHIHKNKWAPCPFGYDPSVISTCSAMAESLVKWLGGDKTLHPFLENPWVLRHTGEVAMIKIIISNHLMMMAIKAKVNVLSLSYIPSILWCSFLMSTCLGQDIRRLGQTSVRKATLKVICCDWRLYLNEGHTHCAVDRPHLIHFKQTKSWPPWRKKCSARRWSLHAAAAPWPRGAQVCCPPRSIWTCWPPHFTEWIHQISLQLYHPPFLSLCPPFSTHMCPIVPQENLN